MHTSCNIITLPLDLAVPEVGFNASSFQANESDSSVQLTVTATTTGLSGYVELYTESGGTAEGK